MTTIDNIKSREILDSRGNPTVEVDVYLSCGAFGRAAVPSGLSKGENEAFELRDSSLDKKSFSKFFDNQSRYNGLGVTMAVSNVNTLIAPELFGMDVCDQAGIDSLMIDLDGTSNKSKLGANAMLGVSLAVAKAAANALNIPLYRYIGGANAKLIPMPMMNILNGGVHSDAPIDIQEFMIVPIGAKTFSEALRMGAETFHALKTILRSKNLSTSVGDEGGFTPDIPSNEAALELIAKAVKLVGYYFGRDISVALDAASSSFYNHSTNKYVFKKSDGSERNYSDMVAYYVDLVKKYPIISIEDGCAQDDWKGWKHLTEELGSSIQLVGDDLFVTNRTYLKKGIDEKVANSILIKPNQIGTLTETLDVIEMAKCSKYAPIISHRSGETEDSTIADIAVATNAGQIKTGSLSRSDRISKYNALLRIEEDLGYGAAFGRKIIDSYTR